VYVIVPPDLIEVTRVVHGARDLPAIFGLRDDP
jgi:hypothetical protein